MEDMADVSILSSNELGLSITVMEIYPYKIN
jgi:hypothetical protein